MALVMNKEVGGVDLPTAYVRVMRIWGSPEEGVSALVGVYAKKAARASGKAPLEQFNVSCPWDSNPIAAAYAQMKQQQEFAAAIDDI